MSILPSHIQTISRALKAGRWKCVLIMCWRLHHPCYSQAKPRTPSANTTAVSLGLPASILAPFHLIFLKAERDSFLKMLISSHPSPRNPSVQINPISFPSLQAPSLRNWPLPSFLTWSHTTHPLVYLTPLYFCFFLFFVFFFCLFEDKKPFLGTFAIFLCRMLFFP